ncbi:hypothetical protein ACQ33O_08520 [Ferruginibacter sp. SUN002]|uniref:hypothetical protein n=1 Tax=Ferruginibacter sp. SUN002 TaxID=2937789 RepID=UPI003D365509
MTIFNLETDIEVYCITAKSFPDGVLEAHQALHALIPYTTDRKYFGISYPEKPGSIIYKAAANELISGELSKHDLEKFIVKKGKYNCILINDFMQNIPAIGTAFQKLISQPDIDPNGCCVEWYLSDKDVRCMVRLSS